MTRPNTARDARVTLGDARRSEKRSNLHGVTLVTLDARPGVWARARARSYKMNRAYPCTHATIYGSSVTCVTPLKPFRKSRFLASRERHERHERPSMRVRYTTKLCKFLDYAALYALPPAVHAALRGLAC